jgi:hypothetical protein
MCALFHGLRLFSSDLHHSTSGRGEPSMLPKEPVRRARRARFALESLETRDLMSGMVTSLNSTSAPASGTVPPATWYTLYGEAVSSTQVIRRVPGTPYAIIDRQLLVFLR